jgi:hypothetical protein
MDCRFDGSDASGQVIDRVRRLVYNSTSRKLKAARDFDTVPGAEFEE